MLWDRQVVDDELYARWGLFRQGVGFRLQPCHDRIDLCARLPQPFRDAVVQTFLEYRFPLGQS